MSESIIAIIGGSGLGDALAGEIQNRRTEEIDTPFGKPSAPILVGNLGRRKVAFLNRHGDGHRLNPSQVPYRANIYALKALGAHTIIASGAVGSLQEKIRPKELVVVDQFIDKTSKRESTFFDGLAVHCELAEPTCKRLRMAILKAAPDAAAQTHESGTYVCMEGPQFSTRAESLMHRMWGADLIGMTAMPEVKLAREAQMCYALIALASDYDCWREHDAAVSKQALLEEIIGNLTAATNHAIELIKATLALDGELCDESCPCRKSLELAVWSKPDRMTDQIKEKLKPLFE